MSLTSSVVLSQLLQSKTIRFAVCQVGSEKGFAVTFGVVDGAVVGVSGSKNLSRASCSSGFALGSGDRKINLVVIFFAVAGAASCFLLLEGLVLIVACLLFQHVHFPPPLVFVLCLLL